MREAKSKELKKDIEILSQTFERVVDRKDAVIKSLAKDLMEAEEQYAMALRSHLQNVDGLIGRYDFSPEITVTLKHTSRQELFFLFFFQPESIDILLISPRKCIFGILSTSSSLSYHLNWLIETIQMSIHIVCFYGEIRKK